MADTTLLLQYTRDAAAILRRCVELYDGGETVFYRVMAVELRLLLCDSTRLHNAPLDLALLPALFPDFKLQPLGGGQALPLASWLEQNAPARGARITIRQLIRQVCDQDGGAHVDRRAAIAVEDVDERARLIRAVAGAVLDALYQRLE